MRSIRLSRSFNEELVALLEQGLPRFGAKVVAEKRALVFRTIQHFLAEYPVRTVDPDIGLCAYPVTTTPFVLIYDYDDSELRIYLIIHGAADRSKIDLTSIAW